MALGQALLQEAPTSRPFKEAFAHLQLFFRGVNDKVANDATWHSKVRKCFVEAEDLASGLKNMGELIVSYSKDSDSQGLEFGLFLAMLLSPVLTVTPSEDSPVFKKASALVTGTLSSVIAFIKKEVSVTALLDEMTKWVDFYSTEKMNTQGDAFVRIANAYRGIQKSISAFPLQEKLATMQPHTAVLATHLHKLLRFVSELPTSLGSHAKSIEECGHLFIEFGSELKKLS